MLCLLQPRQSMASFFLTHNYSSETFHEVLMPLSYRGSIFVLHKDNHKYKQCWCYEMKMDLTVWFKNIQNTTTCDYDYEHFIWYLFHFKSPTWDKDCKSTTTRSPIYSTLFAFYLNVTMPLCFVPVKQIHSNLMIVFFLVSRMQHTIGTWTALYCIYLQAECAK